MWTDIRNRGLTLKKSRPAILAIGSATLFLLSAASDWPFGWLAQFWSEHGMITNLFSSATFLLLGITIIDQWSRIREAERVKTVALVAYHAVARVPLNQRRIMWLLANGADFQKPRDFHWDNDYSVAEDERKTVERVLSRQNLPSAPIASVQYRGEPVPDLQERLSALCTDADWIHLCYVALRRANHSFRGVLARWATLMVSTEQSADVLTAVAASIDDLTTLIRWFRRAYVAGGGVTDQELIHDLVTLWRTAFTNSTALEDGIRLLRLKPAEIYSFASANLLEHSEQVALQTCRDSHGVGIFRVHDR